MLLNYTRRDISEANFQLFLSFLKDWEDQRSYIETYTSGSTGAPKKIQIEKKHMVISAKKTLDFFQLKPGADAILCLSPTTIAGKMMIIRSIIGNLHLNLCEPNGIDYMHIETDFLAIVPMQLDKFLASNTTLLQKIPVVLIGGAALSEKSIDAIRNENIHAFQSFGMTETISHFALKNLLNTGDEYTTLAGVSVSSSNQDTLIVDYPELGLHQLKTNDMVQIHAENRFTWLGRNDFVVNSGGFKLHPEYIESKIAKHIPLPFFLAGIPDVKLGEKLVLCIESEKPIDLDLNTFRYLEQRYMIPKEIK